MLAVLALLVRVQVLSLFHPHALSVQTPRGRLEVRAVGDRVHEGVGPLLPVLALPALPRGARPYRIRLPSTAGPGMPRWRAFAGSLELRARGGALEVIDALPLEEYVASVVGAEMPGAPLEAQKALAVVARSFAARASARAGAQEASAAARAEAPLCDSTRCQLFGGLASASASASAAAQATEGLLLLLPSGAVAPALHHAACGGRTSTAREAWPGASDDEEAASAAIDDRLPDGAPACAPDPAHGDPPLAWQALLDERQLARALGATPPLSLSIVRGAPDARAPGSEPGAGGRVRTLSANGNRPLGAEELHLALGRALGWNRIRSSRIYWSDDPAPPAHPQAPRSPARFLVRGSGFGHGVGLCQRGAARWSRAGEGFRRILSRYFPKLTVGRLPSTPVPG